MGVPQPELTGSYDHLLVTLSVVIAIFAAYTAVDLAERVKSARGVARCIWLGSGAMAMGLGIWCMHYVGMLAFRLPVRVEYDWPTVLLSLIAAVLASAIALYVATRETMGIVRAALGSVSMGCGIAAMHYIGMAAMRLPAMCSYSPLLVTLSIVLAVAAAWTALRMVFHFREEKNSSHWSKVWCAAMLGGAIPLMHYTGMAAAHFQPAPPTLRNLSHALDVTSLGTVSIVVATLMVLAFAVTTTILDRRYTTQTAVLDCAEKRARQILGTSFDAFVELDSDERVTDWNAEAERMFGWKIEEVYGKRLVQLLFPDSSLEAFEQSFRQIRTSHSDGPVHLRFEIAACVRNRRKIPVEMTVSAMRRNSSYFFTAFIRDLTQRERAEEKFKNLLESTSEATLLVNDAGGIVILNSGVERLFGYSRSELLNQSVEILLPPRLRDLHRAERLKFNERPRQRPMGTGLELAARRKDGSEFPVEISLTPLNAGEGTLVSAMIMDITKRKAAEEILRNAKFAAESASQAKSIFLATMSHEIRTPMNGILGMTELVLDSELSVEQRENMEMVRVSAESLLAILDDILDFSKIEAGKMDLESIPFDLRESLGETMKALGFRAQQKGLELLCDVRPEVPEALLGDPGRIRQLLMNLVGNAIKFTEGGEILITVEEESHNEAFSTIHFSVRDTGVGIPADQQQRVFEPFAQADGSMARKYGGSGLGLAICTKLTGLLGGRIWMESQEGVGSTFHFTVPLALQEKAQAEFRPLPKDELRGLRALIVDDNLTNRKILSSMLSRMGMDPVCVEGGRAALDTLRHSANSEKTFSVILMDAQMPEMDGFTLAGIIQKDPGLAPGSSLIILTSAGQMGDAARCREVGISGYLGKPIRQQELVDAITSILKNEPMDKPQLVTRHSLRENRARARILLAEDNPINQKLALRLLEKRGYIVAVAETGHEAVQALEKERFDLILMDIQMPEMNGIEATAAIREKEKISGAHLPIVAMTANALKGDEELCLNAGMDGYISKPIRTEELFKTIELLLRRHAHPANSREPAALQDTKASPR